VAVSSSRLVFPRVLVANRGEIAVRVIRTLRRLGISPAVVYSEADRDALHVRLADVGVEIGPAAASMSYLDVDRIIDAARRTGSVAVHPGYGFLSENPVLAKECERHGIVFIGPPVEAVEAMADKIRAKELVARAGVPVVPGRSAAGLDAVAAAALADEVGYPVLLKPSAGGGGKGMKRVDDPSSFEANFSSAQREAKNAFGDDTILIERYLNRPRHIEIQILADTHGNIRHFGERECSLQRRHQKIVEEAPSLFIDESVRGALGAKAIEAARSCRYVGAGTVEFIMSGDRADEFFFMEMNTRLQVEHPVTEMVYGVDLVEWQVRIAAGEVLELDQASIQSIGHGVEARVYAEDPARDFLPTGGRVVALHEPVGEGIRVDSSLYTGIEVGSFYDPMLAKVIAHGNTRDEALIRLDTALSEMVVQGVRTNIAFVRSLLRHEDVVDGRLHTELVGENLHDLVRLDDLDTNRRTAAVAAAVTGASPSNLSDPWQVLSGWRHGGFAPTRCRLASSDGEVTMAIRRRSDRHWIVQFGEATHDVRSEEVSDDVSLLTIDGVSSPVHVHRGHRKIWVDVAGSTWEFEAMGESRNGGSGAAAAGRHGEIRSPMPGGVVAVLVEDRQLVTEGQPLVIVEAMKMEHVLVSPADGFVERVRVAVGQSVALDQVLVVTCSELT
jgi:acetyl-CoA/propionyl-CoA carboxylase biotin carboxyl carrier protein